MFNLPPAPGTLYKIAVSIGLFWFCFVFFSTQWNIFAQRCIVAQREQVKNSPTQRNVALISIGTFSTNYDVTNIKLWYVVTYSIVRKQTNLEHNNAMETTEITTHD